MQEAITTARRRRPFTILGMVLALITLGAFLYVATRRAGNPQNFVPNTTGTATSTVTPGRNGPTATVSSSTGSSSLTVVMNECDAEYLTWFLSRATLRYTLESFGDYNSGSANNPQNASACPIDKATGITNGDVARRFGAGLVP